MRSQERLLIIVCALTGYYYYYYSCTGGPSDDNPLEGGKAFKPFWFGIAPKIFFPSENMDESHVAREGRGLCKRRGLIKVI